MSGRLLLDTDIIIGLFAQDESVQERLAHASETFVPAIVLGELYYGARKSANAAANLAKIDKLAARAAVLACDADTAREYGRVKDQLRAKGRPVPENDIWIAAIALQHRLTLVSRDAHFAEIEGLSVERW